MKNRLAVAVLALGALGLLGALVLPRLKGGGGHEDSAKIAAMADAWNGAIAFDAGFDARDPALDLAAADDAPRFDAGDDYFGLPRSEGHELVSGMCGACHSLQLVMQQRGDEQRWDGLITQMVRQHAMAAPEPEDRALIARYLARHFPASGEAIDLPAPSAQAPAAKK